MHVTPVGWAYLIGAVLLWRVFAGIWYRTENDDDPLSAVFMGLFGAFLWPPVLVVAALYQACVRWPDLMMRIFIHEPSRERKTRKLERRREEITRLERELGIEG